MDPLLSDLSEEIQDFENLSAQKRKKIQLNDIVTSNYILATTANTRYPQTITNPIGKDAILVGISLVNLTANADASSRAKGTLQVNNNNVLDSISAALLDPTILRVGFYLPIMYEVSSNAQISFELLATVSNNWSLDLFFRHKNFK